MTSQMQGIMDFEQALARISAAVKEETAVRHRGAALVAEDMRAIVAVDTGETRDSIKVREADGETVITSGGASIYLEFGTVFMAAEPFARPAIDEAPAHDEELAAVARGLLLGAL